MPDAKPRPRRRRAGGKPILEGPDAWTPEAPSAIPYDTGWAVPHAMTKDDIKRCIGEFAAAAKRVDRIGYDVIELHGAHGYLAHQFLSPLSNKRTDEYGGSLENRMRFAIEMYEAVRAVWPKEKPLGMRVSATDWVDGGWTPEETVVLAKELKKRGMDYMDVSSGGLVAGAEDSAGAGYQVPFAEKVKKESGITTMTVGLIAGYQQAEDIVASGKADLICLARAAHLGSALGLARGRGAGRRDALRAEDDGRPSQAAAAAVPEAGAAGGLSAGFHRLMNFAKAASCVLMTSLVG